MLEGLLADMAAECDALDSLIAGLPGDAWAAPTPASGWTVAHQVAHLAWTDEQAILSATDPAAFGAMVAAAPPDVVDRGAEDGSRQAPAELLARWRAGRTALGPALAAVPAGVKIPWYGPPMSPASMATARIMETWAHGLDVADALGTAAEPTARLRHVAHIGVRARDYAFSVRGLEPPAEPFHVALTAPDGQVWTWGPEDAAQSVTGPALDFCLLAVQRRNRADLALTAEGADADAWLDVAQAFAGPPGEGRAPGLLA